MNSEPVIFFFSHSPQLKWYTVFAQAFKESFSDCKIILFVHGASDKKAAEQYEQYDEIIDLIEGFVYEKNVTLDSTLFSNELTQLEGQLNASFFWDDLMVDRWVRAKQCPSFTMQYIKFSFETLNKLYDQYAPLCGFGESTAAIYRYAHRLFDRDGRPYMVPVATRYFERFYVETDWALSWTLMTDYYHEYVRNGLPEHLVQYIEEVEHNITQKKNKPLVFETFNKQQNNALATNYLYRLCRIIKNQFLIDHAELENNIRHAINTKTIAQKLKKHWYYQRNKAYFEKNTHHHIPQNIKFCVYFAHVNPEYTTDSMGRFYRDQQYLVNNIAAQLPAGYFLLVKEHPPMIGIRDKSFYEDMVRNNNVILMHSDVDSHELIQHASIVFSIVGTVALEAMFMGKPSILFGKCAFHQTNLITFCDSFWGLGALIRQQLRVAVNAADVKKHALAFLAAKFVASIPGKLPLCAETIDAFVADTNNVQVVKDSFKRELVQLLGLVDNSSQEVLHPATCSRDPEILRNVTADYPQTLVVEGSDQD